MIRPSAVLAPMLIAVVVLSCDRTSEAPATVEQTQPAAVVPTPGPSHTPTPAQPEFRIVATTTEPLFTSASELDYGPYGTGDDRGKIVAHSTLIIIGTVADADPLVERVPGRLTGDPTRPNPNWTTVGYVYDVLVERYLKGTGPATVPMLLPRGHEETVRGTGNESGVLVQTSYSARHLYLEKGGRYLLFLTESAHAPGLWTGTSEPYRYLLSGGMGRVRTPDRNPARPFYTGKSQQDLIDRVIDAIDYQSAVADSGIPHRARWILESLDGSPPLEGTTLSLGVNGNGYGGHDSCNSFGGGHEGSLPVASKDGAFSAPSGGAETLKLCEWVEGLMEQAEAYKSAIRGGETFQIDGDRLKILDGTGEVRLVFARRPDLPGEAVELSGTQWRLLDENYDYGDLSLSTLVFLNEHMVAGVTACRSYVADYGSRSRGEVDFREKRTIGSEGSCSEEIIDLERDFLESLSISVEYAVDASSGERTLRMRTVYDELLDFEPLTQIDEDRIFTERWALEGFTKPDRINSWRTVYSHGTDVIPGTEITISFSENALTGSGECYSYTGSVDIEESMIEVRDVVGTEKPCENVDGMRGQDIRFVDVLEGLTSFRIYGDRLFMRADNYEGLLLRAE